MLLRICTLTEPLPRSHSTMGNCRIAIPFGAGLVRPTTGRGQQLCSRSREGLNSGTPWPGVTAHPRGTAAKTSHLGRESQRGEGRRKAVGSSAISRCLAARLRAGGREGGTGQLRDPSWSSLRIPPLVG